MQTPLQGAFRCVWMQNRVFLLMWLRPLSENLFSPQVRFCKASFFSEPLKYVTQFLSTLLANSAKYPNARSCTKFHSEFLFLTLNTLTTYSSRDQTQRMQYGIYCENLNNSTVLDATGKAQPYEELGLYLKKGKFK